MNQAPTTADLFAFDNSYARLPERFYARLAPETPPAPTMIRVNRPLADALGLDADALESADGVAALSGARPPKGADPIAMAYAGHQFGGWSPQLGDGRAILLGEVIDREGRRRDIQLKGSGRTPYSRMGDGRAPLGPVLREYVVSEAMAALGVPTTRALAAVATGAPVVRETASPGAVLTRVAASHIRVGTFQFFAARQDAEALRLLTDHAIARHEPDAADAAPHERARALLDGVVRRQARLIARWMALGFIHGVMNTDNMTISGETIDYGPCAFMDGFDPARVFSSIDHYGRYAYGAQARIGHWNLAQLAQSLLPILGEGDDEDAALASAQAGVDAYPALFEAAWLAEMRAKVGLATEDAGDAGLIEALLKAMAEGEADFTITFRGLADQISASDDEPRWLREWLATWRSRLAAEPAAPEAVRTALLSTNPIYIARNHLVEEALSAAENGDLAPFDALVEVVQSPFDAQPGRERYALGPKPGERVFQTFCGT